MNNQWTGMKNYFLTFGESNTNDNLLKGQKFNRISDLLNIRDGLAAAEADWYYIKLMCIKENKNQTWNTTYSWIVISSLNQISNNGL